MALSRASAEAHAEPLVEFGPTRSRVEVDMVQMATVALGASGHVLTWGWFSIELANLLIILTMVVLFVVALLVPFGRRRAHATGGRPHRDDGDVHGDRS